jgi:hypothetical protein
MGKNLYRHITHTHTHTHTNNIQRVNELDKASTSLCISEISTMQQIRIVKIKNTVNRKCGIVSFIAGGNVKWHKHFRRSLDNF